MVLNMVLNVVLNLLLNSISWRKALFEFLTSQLGFTLIYITSARHERHECDTSTTRVRDECYTNDTSATQLKNFDFDNDTIINIFSHPYIYYMESEKLISVISQKLLRAAILWDMVAQFRNLQLLLICKSSHLSLHGL